MRDELVDQEQPPTDSSPPAAGRHSRHDVATEHGRWRVTGQHVTVAALVMVAAMAVTGWWVLRAMPKDSRPVTVASDRVVPTLDSTGTPNADASSEPTPAGDASAAIPGATTSDLSTVVVDVTGKVRRPGIVELPAGSRVVDALHRAGGARPGVGTASLNLARVLVDGEQIVVGLNVATAISSTSPTGSTTGAIAPVDLNTATIEQLDTLPGIGPVTAEAILSWRTDNGAFTSVDELLEVSGIGDATLADIEAYVYV